MKNEDSQTFAKEAQEFQILILLSVDPDRVFVDNAVYSPEGLSFASGILPIAHEKSALLDQLHI